jgi:hypothetical protein
MKLPPFTLRYQEALQSSRIIVQMKPELKNRLWMTMVEFNESYRHQPNANDPWTEVTSSLAETEKRLERLLGKSPLASSSQRHFWPLEEYVRRGEPSCALEVVEQFADELASFPNGQATSYRFEQEVNDAMQTFNCDWRLSGGYFFRVDDHFLQEELVQKAATMLSESGFSGANEEFQKAMHFLSQDNSKETITYAFLSFESALKTVVGMQHADVSKLLNEFFDQGYLSDLPQAGAKATLAAL